ncbi:MAG: hypothetical protein R2838_17070 [Caldilineaceae bacterium]
MILTSRPATRAKATVKRPPSSPSTPRRGTSPKPSPSSADDDVADGAVPFSVTTSVASVDAVYAGFAVDDIDAVSEDDDTADIDVATGVDHDRGRRHLRHQLHLDRAPTAAVVLTVTSNDTSEATAAPAQLTFDAETWDQPQSVTITGADDDVAGSAHRVRCDHQCRQRAGLRRLRRG